VAVAVVVGMLEKITISLLVVAVECMTKRFNTVNLTALILLATPSLVSVITNTSLDLNAVLKIHFLENL